METNKKFNPKKVEKLNNPDRKKDHDPELIWQGLGLKQVEVMIDIGAGTGFFALPFSKLYPGSTIYACDSSEAMVGWMQENFTEGQKKHITILQSTENQIPLADGIADFVYMTSLHHELDNPLLMLKEAKRLLKPGGTLMIIDWKAEEMPKGPPLSIRIPEKIVIEQLKQTGFSKITSHPILPFHHMITGTIE